MPVWSQIFVLKDFYSYFTLLVYKTMPLSEDIIQRTIDKMVRSQEKKKIITGYLEEHKPHLLGSIWKKGRIRDCCNVLIFRDYLNGEKKLYKTNFCKYDKFCLACATRRSIKMIQKFEA